MITPALMRMLQIFGNNQEEDPTLQGAVSDLPNGGWNQNTAEEMPRNKIDEILSNVFQQQSSPAMNQYAQHMSMVPERRPRSNLAKIVTTLGGSFLGPERAIKAYDAPHIRALQDWTTKGEALAVPARIEQSNQLKQQADRIDIADMLRKQEYGEKNLLEREKYHTGVLSSQEDERARKQKSDTERARHNKEIEQQGQKRLSQYGRLVDSRIGLAESQKLINEAKKNNPSALEQLRADTAENIRLANIEPEIGKYLKWERGHLIRDWVKISKLSIENRVKLENKIRMLSAKNMPNQYNIKSNNEDNDDNDDSNYEEIE
jgi:hypothetical protein